MALFSLGMGLSLTVEQVTCIVSFLFDVLHEGFQEGRAAVDGVHAEMGQGEEAKTHFLKKSVVDKQQQAVEWFRGQEVDDLFFHLSVAVLFLAVDLIGMCPYLCLYFLLDILRPQFAHQFEVSEPTIELIGEDSDHDPEDLSHDVSPEDGDGNECNNGVDTLDGVLGGDVSIGDGGDDCYAVIDDVGIHLLPVEDECHLVQGPTVIDPAEIGSVGAVVVVLVYPETDHVEEESHVVRIDEAESYQFHYQVTSVQSNVQLRHALELDVDATRHQDLRQPDQLHQVQPQKTSCKRDHHCQQSQEVDPKLPPQILPEDEGDVLDEQSLLIVALEWRDEDVSYHHQDEDDVSGSEVVEIVLPEGVSEGQQQSQLKHVEDDDAHHYELPQQQPSTPRPQLYPRLPVSIHHYFQQGTFSLRL